MEVFSTKHESNASKVQRDGDAEVGNIVGASVPDGGEGDGDHVQHAYAVLEERGVVVVHLP